ncbi:MAG: glycosyltransferase family 4 protein [Gemmatimonadaceae bacterium]
MHSATAVPRTVVSQRPRLLFLAHRLPFPPHNGAAIRTYNVLRLLAREFDIVGLCFDRHDEATAYLGREARLAALSPFGTFETFAIPQQRSRRRFVWDHLRSIITRRAYTYFVHDESQFEQRLRDLLSSERFDLVHVDSLDLVRFLPNLLTLPVICTHHNAESELLRRRADSESSVIRREYFCYQARLLATEERHWIPRVRLNVAVSEDDAHILAAIAPGGRFTAIPNGVDSEHFRPQRGTQEGCVFVGGTTWYPNRDALTWFMKEILPILRARGEASAVTWVGRATERERQLYDGQSGVHLTGYVDDIRPYVAAGACFIAPLRVGGGTRLKILDAWSMAKAVVSTSVGCEGLGAVDGVNILIADEPEAFADAISRVLNDSDLRVRLGTAGREMVERRFSWNVIGASMLDLYRSLLADTSKLPNDGHSIRARSARG